MRKLTSIRINKTEIVVAAIITVILAIASFLTYSYLKKPSADGFFRWLVKLLTNLEQRAIYPPGVYRSLLSTNCPSGMKLLLLGTLFLERFLDNQFYKLKQM